MQRHSNSLQALLVCTALGAAHTGQAQTSPYYVGISQSFSSDSNLFRLPEGAPQTHDVASSTGLIAGIDQPFGRQRFSASGNVRNNRYRDNSQLNNTSYGINAALDWSSAERLSGTLSYSNAQKLANYGDGGALGFTGKNTEKSEQASSTVRVGMPRRLSVEATFQHSSVDYSASQYNDLSYRQDMGGIGVRHEVSGALTVGTGIRYTKGKYPLYGATATTPAVGDSFERKDVDLYAVWVPNGISTVNARVSYGRLTREQATAAGFSGTTGALTWSYKATGKLDFVASLARDTGNETRSFGVNVLGSGTTTAFDDVSRLTTSVQLTANFAATSKLSFGASVARNKRSLTDTLTLGGTGVPNEGSDATTTLSFGARYLPTRNGSLSCNVGRESRTAASSLSYAYSANTANCSAQLVLQ